jgi:hypothetical protein
MNDRIEKRIEVKAPVSRVWRALTDHREFGEWFRVKLDGPFAPGQPSTGHMTYPGYEHVKWNAVVQKNRTGEIIFVYLASVCHRSQNRLLEGNSNSRGIHIGKDGNWNAARGNGIGL